MKFVLFLFSFSSFTLYSQSVSLKADAIVYDGISIGNLLFLANTKKVFNLKLKKDKNSLLHKRIYKVVLENIIFKT